MKLADNKATLSFSNGSPDVELPIYSGSVAKAIRATGRMYDVARNPVRLVLKLDGLHSYLANVTLGDDTEPTFAIDSFEGSTT